MLRCNEVKLVPMVCGMFKTQTQLIVYTTGKHVACAVSLIPSDKKQSYCFDF